VKKHLVSFLILASSLLFISPVLADSPFKVQLYPDQVSVKTGMMFIVRAELRNTTEDEVSFLCHSCAFQKHWIVDNPNVFIQPWTCSADEMGTETLESGEAYEKNLILYISKNDGPGPVTFRLGFVHTLSNGDRMEPVWSDPVTIKVWAPEVKAPEVPAPPQIAAVTSAQDQTGTPAAVQTANAVPAQADQPAAVSSVQQDNSTVEVSETMPDEADDADEPDPDVPPEIAKKIP
jgi:hypothetical protein